MLLLIHKGRPSALADIDKTVIQIRDCKPLTKLRNLRKLIYRKEGTPPCDQILIHNFQNKETSWQILEDENRTLSAYGITTNNIIYLEVAKPGVPKRCVLSHFLHGDCPEEDEEEMDEDTLLLNMSNTITLHPGGICPNKECEFYNRIIIWLRDKCHEPVPSLADTVDCGMCKTPAGLSKRGYYKYQVAFVKLYYLLNVQSAPKCVPKDDEQEAELLRVWKTVAEKYNAGKIETVDLIRERVIRHVESKAIPDMTQNIGMDSQSFSRFANRATDEEESYDDDGMHPGAVCLNPECSLQSVKFILLRCNRDCPMPTMADASKCPKCRKKTSDVGLIPFKDAERRVKQTESDEFGLSDEPYLIVSTFRF